MVSLIIQVKVMLKYTNSFQFVYDNSFVVQCLLGTIHPYFHVGIWCVLEIGRSPGSSSTRIAPSRLHSGILRFAPINSCGTASDFHRTSLLSQTAAWHQLLHDIKLYSNYNTCTY